MNNMPSFAVGMADFYDGPIEDPGCSGLSGSGPRRSRPVRAGHHRGDEHGRHRPRRRVVRSRHRSAAEFPHTALRSAGDPGEHQLPGASAHSLASGMGVRRSVAASRRCRAGEGRHHRHRWTSPARHPDSERSTGSGTRTTAKWCDNDRDALLDYDDLQVYADAGQGGFEIRTFLAVSAAAVGAGHGALHGADPDLRGQLHHCLLDLSTSVRRVDQSDSCSVMPAAASVNWRPMSWVRSGSGNR